MLTYTHRLLSRVHSSPVGSTLDPQIKHTAAELSDCQASYVGIQASVFPFPASVGHTPGHLSHVASLLIPTWQFLEPQHPGGRLIRQRVEMETLDTPKRSPHWLAPSPISFSLLLFFQLFMLFSFFSTKVQK